MVRENSFVESMKFLKDKNNEFAKKQERKVQQSIDERNEFAKNYYKIINNRENVLKENRDFLEMSKAEGLSVEGREQAGRCDRADCRDTAFPGD